MKKESRVESRESGEVRSYRDLIAWQKAMQLWVTIQATTTTYPKEELYSLVQQMRRAACSIPSNIAEGSSRRSTQEFLRFLNISSGSLAELETQVSGSRMLGYINGEHELLLLSKCDELSRILQGLYDSLKARISRLSTLDSSH